MQLVSLRVQATLYIELSRHGVIDAGGAVSYTHLDVYKRQAQNMSNQCLSIAALLEDTPRTH